MSVAASRNASMLTLLTFLVRCTCLLHIGDHLRTKWNGDKASVNRKIADIPVFLPPLANKN